MNDTLSENKIKIAIKNERLGNAQNVVNSLKRDWERQVRNIDNQRKKNDELRRDIRSAFLTKKRNLEWQWKEMNSHKLKAFIPKIKQDEFAGEVEDTSQEKPNNPADAGEPYYRYMDSLKQPKVISEVSLEERAQLLAIGAAASRLEASGEEVAMATSMAPHWTTILVKSIEDTERRRPQTARPQLTVPKARKLSVSVSSGPKPGSLTSRESTKESQNAIDEFGKLQLESTIHKAEIAANDLFRSVTSHGRPSLITYKRDSEAVSRADSASHASTRPQSRLPQLEFLDNPNASRPSSYRWSPDIQRREPLKESILDYDGIQFDLATVILPTGFLEATKSQREKTLATRRSSQQAAVPQPAFSNAWSASRANSRPPTGYSLRKGTGSQGSGPSLSVWAKDSLTPGPGDTGTLTGKGF